MPLARRTRNRTPEAKARSRALRKEMSISERVLWALLRKNKRGFKFRRQFPIGPYVLDFYCPQLKLCVEVDGEQHLLEKDRDARRDDFLSNKGIQTIRIPSLELFDGNSFDAAINRIEQACLELASYQ